MMIFGIFWLLFPLAAAMNMNFNYLFLLPLQRLLLLLLLVPGKHNGMATFSSCCCYEFWLLLL